MERQEAKVSLIPLLQAEQDRKYEINHLARVPMIVFSIHFVIPCVLLFSAC